MKSILRFFDSFVLILSPIAILFFLLGAVMLPIELRSHPAMVKDLAAEGVVAEAVVDYIYDDGKIHFEFLDQEGDERYEILDPIYYTPEVRQTLQLDSVHTIRYMPRYEHSPVLEDYFNQVRAYRKDLSGLYFLLGTSWFILIIRPDFLYIGYIEDWDALFKRRLPESGMEKEMPI